MRHSSVWLTHCNPPATISGMKIQEVIGRNVRQAREDAGLSQRELGDLLGGTLGTPWFPQAVSTAEKGGRDWAAEDLVGVAWVLQRPVSWFFRVPTDVDPDEILD